MTESMLETPRERTMPKASDVVGTGLLALLGLVAVILGLGYGFIGDNDQIGPGFMPVVTGAFILLASLAEIGRLFLAQTGQPTAGLGAVAEELAAEAAAAQTEAHAELGDTGEERDTFGRTAKQRSRTVPLIFAILLAAILLTQVIGMLLSLTLMMFSIVVFVEKKPLVPALLVSGAVLVVAYLIFVQMLGVPLPQGMLGIL
ncbi:tripartite tricarboxylate transporter TctB family protein [Brachybacterium sp. AOP29-B2-41]|uniref:tripartite tricarboxylate transporter TctB family protein n=1 Tax=Brachybacterium sp. AOP29-B2-41 TaxID=3457704 RepID=UPI004034621D